jgi:hypothetical protein
MTMTKILCSALFLPLSIGAFDTFAFEATSNVKFKGDLRFRNELSKVENKKDRLRQRLRGRLGFESNANESIEVGGQLATSEGNSATSTNVTFGGSESVGMKKDLAYVDTFYFKWKASEALSVTGGKFNNPFYRSGGSEMIWDSDLTPEGLAFAYSCQCSESFGWFARGGGLWSKEYDQEADEVLGAAQIGAKAKVGDFDLTIGSSYYDFAQTDKAPGDPAYTGPYTSIPANVEGYQLLNLFFDVSLNLGDHPILFYLDYVSNQKADDKNAGYTLGVKYNKAKEVGSWDVELYHRKLEPNAVIAAIADGDVGSSDVEATRFMANYMLAQNSFTRVSFLTNQLNASTSTKTKTDTVQLDVVFNF